MTEKIKRAVRVKDWTTEIPDLENRFAGLPIAVAYIDGVNWRFLKHISYRTKANEISTIRKGFVLDFASVPQIMWWLYPSTGFPYAIAACWHDWLYCHRKIGGREIKRKEADELFYEIMRYVGCSWWTAARLYRWVRAFGWIPWGRRRPEDTIP